MDRYYNKLVISGNVLEFYEYQYGIKCGFTIDKPSSEKMERAAQAEEFFNKIKCDFYSEKIGLVVDEVLEFDSLSGKEIKKMKNKYDSYQRAKKEVRRMINTNSTNKDKFVTLTFAGGVTKLKEANREWKKFKQRLEYYLKKDLKYLIVPEIQKKREEKTGEAVWHYHIVMFDIPYITNRKLGEIWGNGFVKINKIKGCDNLGAYVSKYMTKDMASAYKQKAYMTSKNLSKPLIIVDHELINKVSEMYSGKSCYEKEFENLIVGKGKYKQINLNRKVSE